MHRTRLARMTAAAVASALVFAGFVAVPASAAPPAPAIITGTLESTPAAANANATVTVYTTSGTYVTKSTFGTTAAFHVSVAAGSYRLQFDFTNNVYPPADWQTPYWSGAASLSTAPIVTVAAGQTLDLGVQTVPQGSVIEGIVRSADALSPYTVNLVGLYGGPSGIVGPVDVDTNAAFRFVGLWPGDYVLSDSPYDSADYLPTTYWPAASTKAAATPITVGEAETQSGIVLSPKRYAAVRGVVTGVNDAGETVPLAGVGVVLLSTGSGSARSATTRSDGSYAILGKPGAYRLQFMGKDTYLGEYWTDAPTAGESTTITLGSTDLTGFDATLGRAGVLSGDVTGPPAGRVRLYRQAVDGTWLAGVAASVADGGTFRFPALPAGEYVLKYEDTGADPDFATTYNSAASLDAATPFTVVAGQELSGLHLESDRVPLVPYARDWTGDGIPDLLVQNPKTQKMTVYAGDGHGGISWAGSWATVAPYYLNYFQLGDFTRGGTPDVADYWVGIGITLHTDPREYLDVYGPNTRVVQTLSQYTARLGPGDWNGDGQADIIVRNTSGALLMFPGNGDGTRGSAVQIGTGWNSYSLISTVGDLSGDGKPDIVARDTAGRLWLYRGNGTGRFNGRVLLASNWQSMTASFGVGDLSGDGKDDLVVRDAAGILWLYRGNDAGHIGARTKLTGTWKGLRFVS